MLKTRIITALILVTVFMTALFFLPSIGWLSFSTLIAALAAWEWGALIGLRKSARVLFGATVAIVLIVTALVFPSAVGLVSYSTDSATALGQWFYYPATTFWLLIVPLWMKSRWRIGSTSVGIGIGLIVILPTWLALLQIKQAGEFVLLAIMATVWLADIAAYFTGRRFGRHKLAPAVSPGKTWEGAIGGAMAVVLYGFMLASALPPALASRSALLFVVLIGFTAISILGDLFESLLKRQAGLKDSSGILPGHGGVLDRIDSLTSTLPIAALVWQYFSF